MGFEAAPATVTVRFKPGHKYHGAEAQVRGMTIGEYLKATGMDGGSGDDTGKTLARFFESLVSWNLTYQGQPLAPTQDAMKVADQALIRAMNNAWIESLTGVADSDPLSETSASGGISPAPPIPMAPLSESQAS
ncbi:hypothetical protein SGLAM104S_01637 [Streptomyces glaucescens]